MKSALVGDTVVCTAPTCSVHYDVCTAPTCSAGYDKLLVYTHTCAEQYKNEVITRHAYIWQFATACTLYKTNINVMNNAENMCNGNLQQENNWKINYLEMTASRVHSDISGVICNRSTNTDNHIQKACVN